MEKEYAEYLLKKTIQDYNLIAEDFSRTRWNIWAEFSRFINFVEDGDRVLDVGCGNGRLLKLLREKDFEYTGVDASENLVKIAKAMYPDKKFLVANALNLPFPENFFDKVFSIAVLHNIPSGEFRLKALQEAKRILRPGGLIILTVWDIWRKEALLLIIKYLFLKITGKSKLDFKDVFAPWGKKTNRYYHYFTKKELCNLAKKAGFKIINSGIVKNETRERSNIYLIARKQSV